MFGCVYCKLSQRFVRSDIRKKGEILKKRQNRERGGGLESVRAGLSERASERGKECESINLKGN